LLTRIPLILAPQDFDRWLHEGDRELLRPCSEGVLKAFPVTTAVNNFRNNSPDFLRPLG
jgi:putative SOS response-associated peptidase YedK